MFARNRASLIGAAISLAFNDAPNMHVETGAEFALRTVGSKRDAHRTAAPQ